MRFRGTLACCSSCDSHLPPGARACPHCGADVADRGAAAHGVHRSAASLVMGLAVAVSPVVACGDDTGSAGGAGGAGGAVVGGGDGMGGTIIAAYGGGPTGTGGEGGFGGAAYGTGPTGGTGGGTGGAGGGTGGVGGAN